MNKNSLKSILGLYRGIKYMNEETYKKEMEKLHIIEIENAKKKQKIIQLQTIKNKVIEFILGIRGGI